MQTKYTRPSANVLLEAAELQEKKGQDYNNSASRVVQADYYPHGVWSILDIINAKYLRMVSVLEAMENGGKPNYESVEDSAIDLINYASFLVAYMRHQVPGQDKDHDIFNKKKMAVRPSGTITVTSPSFTNDYQATYTVRRDKED